MVLRRHHTPTKEWRQITPSGAWLLRQQMAGAPLGEFAALCVGPTANIILTVGVVPLTIRLSVVVACDHAERTIAASLESIAAACSGIPHEILVVHRNDTNVAALIGGSRHVVRTVQAAPDNAIPMSWARGIAVARGEVIARTTGHFFVSESWAHALLAEIGGGAVGASSYKFPEGLAVGGKSQDNSMQRYWKGKGTARFPIEN